MSALEQSPERITLPDRSEEARARLAAVVQRVKPVSLSVDRVIDVPGPLGTVLPDGGVRRGSVVVIGGTAGAGVTSAVCVVLAAATMAGEWVAVVEGDASFGALAAAEAGVDLERCSMVRCDAAERFIAVVGALLDGMGVVVAALDASVGVRLGDARRLAARARERSSVLILVESSEPVARRLVWPAEAALRLSIEGSRWWGLDVGSGVLAQRAIRVRAEGRGQVRTGVLGPNQSDSLVETAASRAEHTTRVGAA